MNKIRIYEAAKIMWNAIKNEEPINSLPKELIPKSKKEAYEIQKTYKYSAFYGFKALIIWYS